MSDIKKLPLLPQQKKLIGYELNDDSKGSQNAGIAFQLKGNVDFDKIDRCLEKLNDLYDTFKMNFTVDENGKAEHKINDNFKLDWIRHDMTDAEEKTVIELAEKEVQTPIDVLNNPLFEFHMYKISDENVFLLVKASHIIIDGPSFTAIYVQLSELYNGADIVKPFMWQEFIEQETEYALSAMGKKNAEYWRNQRIPKSIDREDIEKINYSSADKQDNKLSIAKLKAIAKKNKTSIFNILLFLYNVSLAELFGRDDFAVTYTITNRFKENMRYMVGLTTHNIPYVLENIDSKDTVQLITETKKQLNNGFSNFIMGECAEIPVFTLSYLSETIKLPEWNGLEVIRHPFNGKQNYGDMTYTLICSERKDFIELVVNTDRRIYRQEFDYMLFGIMKKKLDSISQEQGI